MAAIPPPLPVRRLPPPLPARTPPPLPGQRPQHQGPFQSDRDVDMVRGYIYDLWIPVPSTNVNRVMFKPDRDKDGKALKTGTIFIEFLSLAMYQYNNRSTADFVDIMESSSKGRFTYYEVRGPGPSRPGMGKWPSIKLRGPQRKVTAQMRAAHAPQTERQRQRTYTRGGQRHAFGAGGRRVAQVPSIR